PIPEVDADGEIRVGRRGDVEHPVAVEITCRARDRQRMHGIRRSLYKIRRLALQSSGPARAEGGQGGKDPSGDGNPPSQSLHENRSLKKSMARRPEKQRRVNGSASTGPGRI